MKALRFIPFFLACAAVIAAPGCDDEPKSTTGAAGATVTGRWQLFEAFRSDRATETLQGTYFEFHPDGTMQTNMPVGAEAPTPFVIENGTIRQKSTPPVTYRIVSASDSLLELSTELQGLPFVLRFRRAVADSTSMEESFPDTLGIEEMPADSIGQ